MSAATQLEMTIAKRAKKPLILVVFSAMVVAVVFPWARQFPYGILEDDAYFYAQVAYNIGVRGMSTFDGIHVTDGYHLLWTAVLSATSSALALFTTSKPVHLYFYMVASATLVGAIAWRYASNAFQAFVLLGLATMGKLLMETHLLTLLFLETIVQLEKYETNEPKARLFPWLLIALIPVARIDATVMLLGFGVFLFVRHGPRAVAKFAAAAGLGMGAHFLIMKLIAGSFFSVSSIAKSQSLRLIDLEMLVRNTAGTSAGYQMRFILLMALAIATGYLLLSNLRSRRNQLLLAAWSGVLLFSLGHLFGSVLRSWYYVPGHVILTYILFKLDYAPMPSAEVTKAVAKAAVVVALAAYLVVRSFYAVSYRQEAQAVAAFTDRLVEIVPAGGRIYQIDGSGITGFWSERPVINGDGLMNSHKYQEQLLSNNLEGYLEAEDICYIITNRAVSGEHLIDFHGLQVGHDDVEVLLEKEGNGRYYYTNLVLYRLTASRCRSSESRLHPTAELLHLRG